MKLSVIIPTRNRAVLLEKALDSLLRQTLEQGVYEIIIVDNGSSDNTQQVVESFKKKFANFQYIYDDTPGLHTGRHRGLLACNADILVFADDDIKAFPTWLEGIMESFDDEEVALVGGKNLPDFESEPPQWILDRWERNRTEKKVPYLSILDLGDEIKEINPLYVFGCNFSIRKSVLLEAGGFHPDAMPQELIRYRGDGESSVSRYIQKQGYKTLYNPKASVYHLVSASRMTKQYFVKRAYNQGISDSYTAIREGRKRSFFKRRLKHFIKKYFMGRDGAIEAAYLKGYVYHQNECSKDRKLFEWVKRDSYIKAGSF